MKRKTSLDRLQSRDERFDMLIIGGGASGLGAAVDAAARGHRVALIEQDDFAKAASSRSIKLAHGGMCHLKHGEISLARAMLRERSLLLRNAPHLARSAPFVIPCYSWLDKFSHGLGVTMHERLSGRLSLGKSRVLSREEVASRVPTIEQHGLRGGALYHDCLFDDARLAINLAQTAAARGAAPANYCACVALLKENGKIRGAIARDMETGCEFPIRARVVLNATGVFADAMRRLDEPETEPLVVPSRGIHIVLPKKFLPGASALMAPETAAGRAFFAIPWKGRVLVGVFGATGATGATSATGATGAISAPDAPGAPGTTGTLRAPIHAATLEPRATPAELDLVMEHARKHLALDPTENDVLSVFAGLRARVKHGVGVSGDTVAHSRDHAIVISKSGLVTLTGGKWTSYRKMAEDAVDCAERVAGIAHRPCVTATLPILGAEDAGKVDQYASAAPVLAEPVHAAFPELRRAEVLWQVRNEMARTVEDVLARRTRALALDARATRAAAPAVALLMASELGRDRAWVAAQEAACVALANNSLMPSAHLPENAVE